MYCRTKTQYLHVFTKLWSIKLDLCCVFFAFCALCPLNAGAQVGGSQTPTATAGVRIKDIARISCIYDVQLYGYGLVVGLNGTGDSAGTKFTVQSVVNMMRQFGVDIPDSRISVKNVAAVMVTGNLPFSAKPHDRVDVLVSSLGDAKSISGGMLLPTPLNALDGQPYVLAQGSVTVGGFSASGGGNSVQKNHPTVGWCPAVALFSGFRLAPSVFAIIAKASLYVYASLISPPQHA